MTKTKICGLSRPEDIKVANELNMDYIGFVFAKSSRQVTREQARTLKAMLKPGIKAVGVFVKEEATQIAKVAKDGIIDVIQLHGDETPEFCRWLRYVTNKPVIKAIRVKEADSLQGLGKYDCDYFLFDTFSPDSYGGVGKTFPYALLGKAKIPKPFFVAGGLKPDNVEKVINLVHPYGVDTSGGVETNGKKDYAKMADFIKAVKRSDK